jgi:hypothetical protein
VGEGRLSESYYGGSFALPWPEIGVKCCSVLFQSHPSRSFDSGDEGLPKWVFPDLVTLLVPPPHIGSVGSIMVSETQGRSERPRLVLLCYFRSSTSFSFSIHLK